jgi:hypothetical protein
MKRLMLSAAVITAFALSLGARTARADSGADNPECLGMACGAPQEGGAVSLWDSVLGWLGLE